MIQESESHVLYYTDELITNLQLRWGDGFMSPGGARELARMLHGIDISGAFGLDFGCGIGGYDFLMVEEHDARKIVCVDIDAATIGAARDAARNRDLADRLEFISSEPGPLPFRDAAFDFVFSKDAIVDLTEKAPVFSELYRVTRPGGHIIVSDWFRSAEPFTEEMRAWATTGDETYKMDTLSDAAAYVSDAGFVDIELDDRNEWFRSLAHDEYERLKGPLYPIYVQKFGEEQAKSSVENARIRALLADQGQLRPGHIRGRKPA